MEHYEQEVIREQKDTQYPVGLTVSYPEHSSRGLALATLLFMIPKMILAIPHIVALYFLGALGFIAAIAAQIVVLFTGKYPHTLFKFVRGVFQWQMRVNCFMLGLTDKYPPFSFD